MRIIETTDILKFSNGIVKLTEAQANPRKENLVPLGDDVYRVKNTVTFKRGESFGYEGDIPRYFIERIKPAEDGIESVVEDSVPELIEDDFGSMHHLKLKKLVEAKGGVYIDKLSAIEFLQNN